MMKRNLKTRVIGMLIQQEAPDAGQTSPETPAADTPHAEGSHQHHQGPTGRRGIRVPTGEGHREHHGCRMKTDVTWQGGIEGPRISAQRVVAGGQARTPWEAAGAMKMSGRSFEPVGGAEVTGPGHGRRRN